MTPYNTNNRKFTFFPSNLPLLQQTNQCKEEKRKYKVWSTTWSQNCTRGGGPSSESSPDFLQGLLPQTWAGQRGHKDGLKPLSAAASVCYLCFIPPREVTNNLFLPLASANHPTFPYLKWRIGRLMRCRSGICSLNTPESFQGVVYL